MTQKKEPKMLVEKTEYLTSGVHIGMKSCTPYMKKFVYKVRDDGLAVFNLQKVDERIAIGAKFLSKFDNLMIISKKDASAKAVKAFAEATDSKAVIGRFSPGTLTNPSYKSFYEPDIVFVIDPLVDIQVIKEAKKKRVPIVAFCDTFNSAKDIDYIIPINNNGKKALILVLWILAKEIQKIRGKKFSMKIKDFGDEETK